MISEISLPSFGRDQIVGLLLLTIVPIGTLSLLPSCYGQTPTEPTSTIHVQSQLVLLDVVVTDSKGNVVTNLNRDDFSVYENGVAQEIRNFEPLRADDVIPTKPTKDKSGNDNWGNAPLTIFVVDQLNTPFEESAYARQQVERFLKVQPPLLKQPAIVLWLNDTGLQPLTSFTRDRDTLMTAVDQHKAGLPDKYQRGAVVEQLSQSLSALQQVALFSRGNKGSKQIIWVGRSFPGVSGLFLGQGQRDLLQSAIGSTIDLLLSARATLYVIDPTLDVQFDINPVSDIGGPRVISAFDTKDPFAESFSFFDFVRQTGGKYFFGRNDLNNEIVESIVKGTSFYSLGYVPSSSIEEGKYKKIDIRMRDSSLQVQTKEGYYPVNPAPISTALDANNMRFDLRESLLTGMVYNSVGLHIEQCRLKGTAILATCSILLDNGTVSFVANPNGDQSASILTVIAALNSKSLLLANGVKQLRLAIPSASYNPGNPGRTRIQLQIQIPPGAAKLRIAVRDASGRIGTADVEPQQLKALIASARVQAK